MSVFIADNCAGGRAGVGAAGVGIVWYCVQGATGAEAGEGLEEELEPYIKLAPGVGYYRHTDLGGSPPRHHLFLLQTALGRRG